MTQRALAEVSRFAELEARYHSITYHTPEHCVYTVTTLTLQGPAMASGLEVNHWLRVKVIAMMT